MADQLQNLVEFAKGIANSDPVGSGMIETFAAESDVLQTIGFKAADQGQNTFYRETSEPNVGFRALNEEPDISHGTEERFQDVCAPISGLIEFDRIKLKRYGEAKRTTYMKGQMKKGSRVWTDTFINGDVSTDHREFNGLKVRCKENVSVDGTNDDSRLFANSAASGGAPLSLGILDQAEQLVHGGTHLLLPRRLVGRFKTAARDPNLTNNRITDDYDSQLGRRVTRFGELELLHGYDVSKDSQFLPFNEVAYGGGAAETCSLYVVSFREDGLCGIQTSGAEFKPVDTDRGVFERDLFEWDSGITVEDEYSILRISSVTDAAIVQ